MIRTNFQENVAGTGGLAGANVGGGAFYSGMGSCKTIRIGAASFLLNQAAGPDEPSLVYCGAATYNTGLTLRVASRGFFGNEHIHFKSSVHTYDLSHTAMEAANYLLAASVTVTETNNVTATLGFTATPEDGADNLLGTSDDDYVDLGPAAASPLVDAGNPEDLSGDWMDLDEDGITGAEREVIDAAANSREVRTVNIGTYQRQ